MSDHTGASLAALDALLPLIKALPASSAVEKLTEEAEALRRAVAAFHMEAIRFRIYNVDRQIKQSGDDPALRKALEDVRHALEAAGFHTRSHVAP
jgi:hypothetical protein